MEKGLIYIYGGEGHGKSPAALGRALQSACRGEDVLIIRFLKGRGLSDSDFIKRLEPEIKIFRFEKSDEREKSGRDLQYQKRVELCQKSDEYRRMQSAYFG